MMRCHVFTKVIEDLIAPSDIKSSRIERGKDPYR